jgi:hypothetical protein
VAQGDVGTPEVAGEVEVVDTEVQQHARRADRGRTDPGQLDARGRIGAHEARERPDHRVEALGVAHEESCIGARAEREGAGLGRARAQGLLDQDVPSRGQRIGHGRGVRLDRRRDDDDVGAGDDLRLGREEGDAVGGDAPWRTVVRADQAKAIAQG